MPEPEDIKREDTATEPEPEDIEVVAHGDGDPDELEGNCYTNNSAL